MIYRPGYRRQFQDLFPHLYPDIHKVGDSPLVKTITFITTESCSLRCTYCYECNKNHDAYMSIDTAKKGVDMILSDNMLNKYMSSTESPGIIIEFIGGEPFMNVDVMDFICDYFISEADRLNHPWRDKHVFSVTTNGVHYFEPSVQKFLKKNRNRLSLGITIDGNKDLHDSCRLFPDGTGSYDIVSKAIKDAKSNFGLKSTKVTLAPENLKYMNIAIPHLVDEFGITDVFANPVFEDVWDDTHPPIYYRELIKLADWFIDTGKYRNTMCTLLEEICGQPMGDSDTRNWCGGNGNMLAIGTDGTLYPCLRFMRMSLIDKDLPEFIIGNVTNGINDCTQCGYIQELWGITRSSQSTQECIDCKVASGCAWCTGYNYDVFKTPNKRATFICGLHKARHLANYYYWNTLYKLENTGEKYELNMTPDEINELLKGDVFYEPRNN